jgi:hypothetical protein
MDKNEEVMRRWFAEVWNKGDVSTIDELLAPDAIVDGLLPDQNHNGVTTTKKGSRLNLKHCEMVNLPPEFFRSVAAPIKRFGHPSKTIAICKKH